MARRRKMARRSESEWKELINKFDNRSCSANEFARRYRISKSVIYGKRKLLKLDSDESACVVAESNNSGFIPISVDYDCKNQHHIDTEPQIINASIKISNHKGLTCDISSGIAVSELKLIIGALDATC